MLQLQCLGHVFLRMPMSVAFKPYDVICMKAQTSPREHMSLSPNNFSSVITWKNYTFTCQICRTGLSAILSTTHILTVFVQSLKSCPTLQPHELEPTRLLSPWGFSDNTGVCSHFLLQGIFPTQGSNLHLLHWDKEPLSHQGSPKFLPNVLKFCSFT